MPSWQAIASALVVGAFAFLLHEWVASGVEADHQKQIKQVQAAMDLACTKTQKVNDDVETTYQTNLDALRTQLANARRVQPPHACIPLKPSAGDSHEAATGGELPDQGRSIDRNDILDLGYDAEQVGLQLDALQSWVSQSCGK